MSVHNIWACSNSVFFDFYKFIKEFNKALGAFLENVFTSVINLA